MNNPRLNYANVVSTLALTVAFEAQEPAAVDPGCRDIVLHLAATACTGGGHGFGEGLAAGRVLDRGHGRWTAADPHHFMFCHGRGLREGLIHKAAC